MLILFQLPVGGGGAVLVLSELESMAARQQREIAQQRRLLEQREARLAVLRGAQVRHNLILLPLNAEIVLEIARQSSSRY